MLLHLKCIFSLFRKSFGATLVKRVRKAGSDFMNKVPRVSIRQVNEGLQIHCIENHRVKSNYLSFKV
jgi:hypothetical protein